MDPQVTHFLFTSLVGVGIVSVTIGTLVALPWSPAEQASTERGLAYGVARIAQAVSGALGLDRRADVQPG